MEKWNLTTSHESLPNVEKSQDWVPFLGLACFSARLSKHQSNYQQNNKYWSEYKYCSLNE